MVQKNKLYAGQKDKSIQIIQTRINSGVVKDKLIKHIKTLKVSQSIILLIMQKKT